MTMKKIVLLMMTSFFFLSGCGYGLYVVQVDPGETETTPITTKDESEEAGDITSQYYGSNKSQDPVILTHADIDKKKVYISRAKEMLMQFRILARDTRKLKDDTSVKELGREANSYVKNYIEPIISDPDATENLETKAEIARLYLLSAALYFDLAGYYQAKYYLNRLTEQYEGDFLSSVTIDQMGIGFNTLAEGIEDLKNRISSKQTVSTENT